MTSCRITPEVTRAIVATHDLSLRNLQITQAYYELGHALFERTGSQGINWCMLGTWASKTAGTYIRGHEVPSVLRKLVGPRLLGLERRLGIDGVAKLVDDMVDSVSDYIMEGNRVVFLELGEAVAALLAELGSDARFDADRLAVFQRRFRPGAAQPDKVWFEDGVIHSQPQGGQDSLAKMCAGYYRAMFETDDKRRAELLLLANAYGGLHEQTRLQSYIAGSLNAPVEDLIAAHCKLFVHKIANALLQGESLVDAKEVAGAFCSFSTVAMMTLDLPSGSVDLSRPLRSRPGHPLFPTRLETIADPELAGVLEHYGALQGEHRESLGERLEHRVTSILNLVRERRLPSIELGEFFSRATISEVGATNWTSLEQRLRFIFSLFRSLAEDEGMRGEPFTEAQAAAIVRAEIPAEFQ